MSENSRSARATTSPVRPLGEMTKRDPVHRPAAATDRHHLTLPRRTSLQQISSSESLVHEQIEAIEEEHNDAATQANHSTQDHTRDDDLFRSHSIQPSDTFSGICLKYGITATQLRRANLGFSGTNLALAPNPLRIPKENLHHGGLSSSPTNTLTNTASMVPQLSLQKQEQYIRKLRRVYESSDTPLAETEARCYLELNDWNLAQTMENISQDLQGKKEHALDPNGEEARFDTPLEFVVIDEEL